MRGTVRPSADDYTAQSYLLAENWAAQLKVHELRAQKAEDGGRRVPGHRRPSTRPADEQLPIGARRKGRAPTPPLYPELADELVGRVCDALKTFTQPRSSLRNSDLSTPIVHPNITQDSVASSAGSFQAPARRVDRLVRLEEPNPAMHTPVAP